MQQWQNKFISSYTIVVYNRFGWTGNKLPWFLLYCSYKIKYLEIADETIKKYNGLYLW